MKIGETYIIEQQLQEMSRQDDMTVMRKEEVVQKYVVETNQI
ncbi:MAG TPA: hypothetical protein VEW92_02110 [Nitrososphaeraceae archaeon]|jgi:hypothetical protein|nr:hypothetical protein [Nitrososphaeraceae archaeon]